VDAARHDADADLAGRDDPGQLGPTSSVLEPRMRSRVRIMSRTGMPSVMHTDEVQLRIHRLVDRRGREGGGT
jgi:hypothetical protein